MKAVPSSSLIPQVVALVGIEFDSKFAPFQRMASAIIDVTNKRGNCEPKDLLSLGFTKQETTDLWHMAHAMASIELRLMAAGGNHHAYE